MQVELKEHELIARKSPGDKPIRGESQLLHRIKEVLRKQGYDVIKKEMVKDGHMVSEGVYYLRQRQGKWAIWNSGYQIYDASQDYNKHGYTSLNVEKLS